MYTIRLTQVIMVVGYCRFFIHNTEIYGVKLGSLWYLFMERKKIQIKNLPNYCHPLILSSTQKWPVNDRKKHLSNLYPFNHLWVSLLENMKICLHCLGPICRTYIYIYRIFKTIWKSWWCFMYKYMQVQHCNEDLTNGIEYLKRIQHFPSINYLRLTNMYVFIVTSMRHKRASYIFNFICIVSLFNFVW